MASPLTAFIERAKALKASGRAIGYTPERLEYELDVSHFPKSIYSKGSQARNYLAWMHPGEFWRGSVLPQLQAEFKLTEAQPLDLARLRRQTQSPFYNVDDRLSKVTGHEGRHRALALEQAGYDLMPVIMDLGERPLVPWDAYRDYDLLTTESTGELIGPRAWTPLSYENRNGLLELMDAISTERFAAGGPIKKAAKLMTKQAPLSDPLAQAVALRMQALLEKGAELEQLPAQGLNLPAAYAGDQRSQKALQRRLNEQPTGLAGPSRRKFIKDTTSLAARQLMPELPGGAISAASKLAQLSAGDIPDDMFQSAIMTALKRSVANTRKAHGRNVFNSPELLADLDEVLHGGKPQHLTELDDSAKIDSIVSLLKEADNVAGSLVPPEALSAFLAKHNYGSVPEVITDMLDTRLSLLDAVVYLYGDASNNLFAIDDILEELRGVGPEALLKQASEQGYIGDSGPSYETMAEFIYDKITNDVDKQVFGNRLLGAIGSKGIEKAPLGLHNLFLDASGQFQPEAYGDVEDLLSELFGNLE